MAPMPAAAPANTRTRRSRGLSFKVEARKEPKPAPIWAMGPSLPAEPPVPMVMAEATILTKGTRFRMKPPRSWKASIMASVPWPSASGAMVNTRMPEIKPPRVGTKINSKE
jgi:hypothetical protein